MEHTISRTEAALETEKSVHRKVVGFAGIFIPEH